MASSEQLFGKTLDELRQICAAIDLPTFTAGQISDWLYKKTISSVDEMTNLSAKTREVLADRFDLGLYPPSQVQKSADGTKKYLYRTGDRRYVESVYIPNAERATLCVSSQIGCKMGCLFCMTGKQGFQAHLRPGEILNQIHSLPEKEKLTNVVFMGMGEPLDNLEPVLASLNILTADWGYAWSPRRLTVSTIGLVPAMKTFLERSEAHLAVSLNSPFEEERRKLMPMVQAYPLSKVMQTIRTFDWGKQRSISFEYIPFKGLNDSPTHVSELVKLLHGIQCRVNLIRFHPIPGTSLEGSDDQTVQAFRDQLSKKGIFTTVRASRGEDILAACGLLSTKEQVSGTR